MKKVLVVIAILAAAAACGSSTTAGSGAARLSLGAPAAVPAPVKGQVPSDGSVAAPGQSSSSSVPALGPQVIKQAQLTIGVNAGSFESSLTQVRALVELEHGFISGTDAQVDPQVPQTIHTGVVTFMVPADKFDETIDAVARLGKIQNEHISGQDVSAQYVDLQARLANEEAQRQAMLALLSRAQSVSDIIAIQTQLGEITGQIEQLKGQIQYLDHNTAFSSVSVEIVEAGVVVQPAPSDPWGFMSALGDAAHNFVTTINYVISGLGAIGPILIVVGAGYLVWRRRRTPGMKGA
jgi:hypothetical protein